MEWLNYIEVARLVFVFSIILALMYKKRFSVTPGGIIVPGAMLLNIAISWRWAALLLAVSFITYFIDKYIISNFAISQKKVSYMVFAISIVLSVACLRFLTPTNLNLHISSQTGLMLPGLLALSYRKYGVEEAFKGFGLVFVGTYAFTIFLTQVLPRSEVTELSVLLSAYPPLQAGNMVATMMVALIAGFMAFKLWNVRSGGYVIMPYLALLLVSSTFHFMIIILEIIIVWLIVQMILKYTLIIGLERFAVATIVSILTVTFVDYFAASQGVPSYYSSVLILPIAVAVIVNDLSISNSPKVLTRGIPFSLGMSGLVILYAGSF